MMDSTVTENILGTSLVPTIMGVLVGKSYSNDKLDLLYVTTAVGITIATATSALSLQLRWMSKSRNQLTILTTATLTLSLIASIVSFHLVRHNFSPSRIYQLPENLRDQRISDSNDVFRYHFYTDFIPGFILFSQAQLCSLIIFDLMNRAKRNFALSEAFIVAQLVSGTYLIWALTTYSSLTDAGPFRVEQTTSILLNVGMIFCVLVFAPSYLLIKTSNSFMKYSTLVLGIFASYVVTQNTIRTAKIGDPFTWLVDYIFATHQRISLFSLWLSTLAACVSFSTSWSHMVGQTNSLVRKVFHLATCVVFISGYNQDLDFTAFAAGGMFILMAILETIRAWNLWPIGYQLERVCQSLRGRWDNRYLTLSHIYLLVGMMIPVWLIPSSESNKLVLSSGLISLGVGDTAAAVIGTFYGKSQISPKSKKTVEGLVGNILAMALFKQIWVGYSGFLDEFSFAMAAVLTAFAEATSLQCDNLVLPLVMILALEIF